MGKSTFVVITIYSYQDEYSQIHKYLVQALTRGEAEKKAEAHPEFSRPNEMVIYVREVAPTHLIEKTYEQLI